MIKFYLETPVTIRILNCAAMSPWLPRWYLGTPCLLVETEQGVSDRYRPWPA